MEDRRHIFVTSIIENGHLAKLEEEINKVNILTSSLLIDIWRNCTQGEKDFISLGDMNLCAKQCDEPTFQHKDLASLVKDFMYEENCSQLVNNFTRIRSVGGTVQRSCLDHVTTNCVNKVSPPIVIGVGKSDHMGIIVTKSSKELRTSARTTWKRIYKNFDKEAFLKDIEEAKRNGKFEGVHTADNPDEAFRVFEVSYCEVLDRHAPIKVIQNRTDYVPYITTDVKKAMDERNDQTEHAAYTGNLEDYNEYKRKRNEVTMMLKLLRRTTLKINSVMRANPLNQYGKLPMRSLETSEPHSPAKFCIVAVF